jgi:hypothetical protein
MAGQGDKVAADARDLSFNGIGPTPGGVQLLLLEGADHSVFELGVVESKEGPKGQAGGNCQDKRARKAADLPKSALAWRGLIT